MTRLHKSTPPNSNSLKNINSHKKRNLKPKNRNLKPKNRNLKPKNRNPRTIIGFALH